ncbi:DUF58 domain-containing protein [Spartinivicinus poritis]|uniref:DUF58 domain-containing protein n=1 Tax=Spartinivicinus poritis TaxID=2994640 RepID=A0ABT5U509_9GAMM|nr:DUF58 domain-containing protein [Spartinivicinus sp. A2-2]MDE1461440.1 DUF58 domain-containing protein [Spartinivicinus sp. A2-2]
MRQFKPSQPLLYILALFTGLGLIQAFIQQLWPNVLPWFSQLLLAGLLIISLLALADLILSKQASPLTITRQLPHNLALSNSVQVAIQVHHQLPLRQQIELYDHVPNQFNFKGLPLTLELQPGKFSIGHYDITPHQRGPALFTQVEVRVRSQLGLWAMQFIYPVTTEVKVYPNFATVTGYNLLANSHHTSQLGIRKQQRRGEGMDFHQLREYRPGDPLRQVDWKATARRLSLISKEYQDERDQQILILLDSGKRMRIQDGQLTHFDHALNSLLLLALVALKQGDMVGMMSFGQNNRWVPGIKGTGNIHMLLNNFYDLYPDAQPTDYIAAAEDLMTRQRKRALVVLVTNLRDEDTEDLIAAIKLLRRKHLVLLVNLQETAIQQVSHQPISDFPAALRYLGAFQYLTERSSTVDKLVAEGALILDCTPQEMMARLVNRYLDIKRSGRL